MKIINLITSITLNSTDDVIIGFYWKYGWRFKK